MSAGQITEARPGRRGMISQARTPWQGPPGNSNHFTGRRDATELLAEGCEEYGRGISGDRLRG